MPYRTRAIVKSESIPRPKYRIKTAWCKYRNRLEYRIQERIWIFWITIKSEYDLDIAIRVANCYVDEEKDRFQQRKEIGTIVWRK